MPELDIACDGALWTQANRVEWDAQFVSLTHVRSRFWPLGPRQPRQARHYGTADTADGSTTVPVSSQAAVVPWPLVLLRWISGLVLARAMHAMGVKRPPEQGSVRRIELLAWSHEGQARDQTRFGSIACSLPPVLGVRTVGPLLKTADLTPPGARGTRRMRLSGVMTEGVWVS